MAKFILPLLLFAFSGFAQEAKYTLGKFHNYSHADGTVPRGDYQYSVFVPKDYDPKKSYPLVFGYMAVGGATIPTRESGTWFLNACGITVDPQMRVIVAMCPITLGTYWFHQ